MSQQQRTNPGLANTRIDVTDDSDAESDETSVPYRDRFDTTPEDNLDRRPGSGSLSTEEAWSSQAAQSRRPSNDGRYDTRTTFYFDGTHTGSVATPDRSNHQLHRDPADRRDWEELAKWNDGMHATAVSRGGQNWHADVRRWIETFSSRLHLSEVQTDRVRYVLNDVSIDFITNANGVTAEAVILGAISLVVDADTQVDDIESWDIDDWIVHRDAFVDLMDDVDMTYSDLWYTREQIQDRTDFFDD